MTALKFLLSSYMWFSMYGIDLRVFLCDWTNSTDNDYNCDLESVS